MVVIMTQLQLLTTVLIIYCHDLLRQDDVTWLARAVTVRWRVHWQINRWKLSSPVFIFIRTASAAGCEAQTRAGTRPGFGFGRPNRGSSADLLPARWTCWGCESLRWPNPAPRPCWSAAASLFPSAPSAGVSNSTAGHFRVRLCACAPSFRVSAGKWRQKQRFLHQEHVFFFTASRWSNSSVRDWSSSGRWQKTSKWRKYTENVIQQQLSLLLASKRHNSHY